MHKEIIRNLCRWMAHKHGVELSSIRVGDNQETRLGSATVRRDFLTGDIDKLSISVSTYNTDTGSEYWDIVSKVKILDTIVHEFAHLALFNSGHDAGHGRIFRDKYHEFLKEDWKELVQMYNLLAVDTLNDSWETLIKFNTSSYFDHKYLENILGNDIEIDHLYILRTILSQKKEWVSTLAEIEKFGMKVEIGNEELAVFYHQKQIASIVKNESILCEKE